jgi:endoribonuclease Dicer
MLNALMTHSLYRKTQSNPDMRRNDSVSVVVHDEVIVGPITATNLSLSKGLAAERARNVLADPTFDKCLEKLCDCVHRLGAAVPEVAEAGPDVDPVASSDLTDETEEGFAAIAKQKLQDGVLEASQKSEEFEGDVEDMDLEDMDVGE